MFAKRIKIFIALSLFFLFICILRLAQLQLIPDSSQKLGIQERITRLKRQWGRRLQLNTLRGRLLDRTGKVIAVDEPLFELNIKYELTSCLDERVKQARLLRLSDNSSSQNAEKLADQIRSNLESLDQIMEKAAHFGQPRQDLEDRITNFNNQIWNLKLFQAWRQNCSKSEFYQKNKDNLLSVRPADFIADFQNQFPDANQQLLLIEKTDIAEMYENFPLFELKTADDTFTAQLEFMNFPSIEIEPRAKRIYTYGSAAAQTIGWVSLPLQDDARLFENDRFLRYLDGEVSGRTGVEYVCEPLLRGKRGEIFTDIDGNKSETPNQAGSDVTLTIDIELQRTIEDFLSSYHFDSNCGPGIAAVVIDVSSSQILAMASLPTFDLNFARYEYDRLLADSRQPLINRCIYSLYPPGSSIKPVILTAGLQCNNITPSEIISCPPQRPPAGWPQCWITKQFSGVGHDQQWAESGGNMARNALRGSCNIYFSRLADRIEPNSLQLWLYKFGFGRKILYPPADISDSNFFRTFSQSAGIISSSRPYASATSLEQLPRINPLERKFFGIGQGNLRVTVLQVANAMAAIARGGVLCPPRLFIPDPNDNSLQSVPLDMHTTTLNTIYDGMSAVVNERNGTAYSAFIGSNFSADGVRIYGKTGSTEAPENAWFAGFAKDNAGRCIALAVVVEGGQHGASDAAPLGRQIIKFCIDSGYLGNSKPPQE